MLGHLLALCCGAEETGSVQMVEGVSSQGYQYDVGPDFPASKRLYEECFRHYTASLQCCVQTGGTKDR